MNATKIRIYTFLCRLLLVTLLLCTGLANAQTVTGSITGQVTDATGAAIPNATVTAINVDTGVGTAAQTNKDGICTIRFLPIGQYKLTPPPRHGKVFRCGN